MKRIRKAFWLMALWALGVMGQVPMESEVKINLSYAPRSSATSAVRTFDTAKLIGLMGLSGGSIFCVGDAGNPAKAWTFKHVVPARSGGSAVESDLSEKMRLEVLGYSDVGTVKAPSKDAPIRDVILGSVVRMQTVKLEVTIPARSGVIQTELDFWGSLAVTYAVVQPAGSTSALWLPKATSFNGVGTNQEGTAGIGWGSMSVTIGAFTKKVVLAPRISAQPVAGVIGNSGETTLSVVASGVGPFTYQWRKDGVLLTGATGATYAAKEAGSYTVVVSNAGGSVTSLAAVVAAAPVDVNAGMVLVKGGVLPAASELKGQSVGDFLIGKYEVTWEEWKEVRDWAASKGYDIGKAGVGVDTAPKLPVRNVGWYHAVKWCNARSEKAGRKPVYQLNGAVYRTGSVAPTVDPTADGYRLPLEAEWEWAARGGVQSKGYAFSGSNNLWDVGWYNSNVNNQGVRAVGTRAANELGIYDMSGNMWEWCFDQMQDNRARRGGCWDTPRVGPCAVGARSSASPANPYNSAGFRVAAGAVVAP